MGCLYGWEKETGKLISVFISLKMVFFAAQQHFFDNSKWADTQVCPYRANSKGRDESRPYFAQTAEFAGVVLRQELFPKKS
jgi:hypothetical protein